MDLRGNEEFLKNALYPCVRVRTERAGGSGQVIHSSKENGTFILTCEHVVDGAIEVKDKWSPLLQRNVKKDVLSPVSVEFFRYSYRDRATGAEMNRAEIVAYDKDEDIALLRLESPEPRPYVAKIFPCEGVDDESINERIDLGAEIVTIGAALGHDPVPTIGNLAGFRDIIENRVFWLATAPSIFGNCLSEDTLISMADRSGMESIKNVKVGSRVLSYVFGKFCNDKIEKVINSGVKRIYEIKTRNHTLRASANHPLVQIVPYRGFEKIYNIPQWKQVRDLQPGDVILTMPSSTSTKAYISGDTSLLPNNLHYDMIEDIKDIGEAETYDIKLEKRHVFFANGVLVHNSGGATFLSSTWEFIGMPARISVSGSLFSADAITHMGYIIPITRIVTMLKDNLLYFLFDENVTYAECKKMIEERRKKSDLEVLLNEEKYNNKGD